MGALFSIICLNSALVGKGALTALRGIPDRNQNATRRLRVAERIINPIGGYFHKIE